jgi:uncharacterized membrane protein
VKEKNGWYKTKNSAVVVDTDFSKEKNRKMIASPWWFLIPAIIIVINILICFNVYHKVPDMIPEHWNALGQANRWVKKYYKSILIVPLLQCFITISMFLSYKVIGWSKQQISASNPEKSKKQSRIFRYVWSVYMIAITIIINLFFTFLNLNRLQVIESNSNVIKISTLGLMCIIFIGSLMVIIRTGQGGSRIKLGNIEDNSSNLIDRDDDKYWKLGSSFYVNKDDPALFIEKRFGIGWTMNFGRIESIVITVVFVAIAILMPVLLK